MIPIGSCVHRSFPGGHNSNDRNRDFSHYILASVYRCCVACGLSVHLLVTCHEGSLGELSFGEFPIFLSASVRPVALLAASVVTGLFYTSYLLFYKLVRGSLHTVWAVTDAYFSDNQ